MEHEKRVLFVAPTIRDACITCDILRRAGCAVVLCPNFGDLCAEIHSGAGAVLLTDEALKMKESLAALCTAIERQPKWSDLPIVILSSGGADSSVAVSALQALHNVLVLDRPVHLATLVSAVKTALLSRERQYEIRDLLDERKKAEERLAQALARAEQRAQILDAIFEHVPEGITIADAPDLRISMMSQYGTRLLGGNFVGMTAAAKTEKWRIYLPDGKTPFPNEELPLAKAVNNGEVSTDIEVVRVNSKGDRLFLSCNAGPIRNPSGQITGGIVAWREISGYKRAEAELRKLAEQRQLALDASYMGWWHYDPVTKIESYDKRYGEIFDVTGTSRPNEEIIARLHPDDLPGVRAKVEAALDPRDPQPYAAEYRIYRADGSTRWIEAHGIASFEGEGDARRATSFVGTVADITERKQAEEQIKESDRRKDEFLAMLGHELRNPLAAITTGLRLLRSRNAEQHEWVKESLERQTKQLVGLVDDLLDIARIKHNKIRLRPGLVDLRAIARNAAESTVDLMTEKNHTFTISCPEMPLRVIGDPIRLQQIISNLLNNAAKYTDHDGRIELMLARIGEEAVICVKDNGMGIPADMQRSVFELFGQVDSAEHRPQQGLGIGLSLVKMLVEGHNGNVSVISEGHGKGSEFTIRLPLVESAECDDEDRVEEGIDEEPLDILVVEDRHETARMLGTILREKGHRVRLAEDGKKAVELAADRQPDLVILDVGLPDISGYEVAETLRQKLGYNRPLIIAATGYGQERDRQRSREAGIDHHLVKPIEYETVALLARQWRRTAARNRAVTPPPGSAGHAHLGTSGAARILIIDDNRTIAQITQQVLRERGHEAEVAFDAPSGIRTAKSFRPELVLCDLNLPGSSGFDVLNALKSEPGLQEVLVAAMTGYDEDEHRERTRKAGFDAHLVKPVDLKQIDALIDRLFRKTGRQRILRS